MRTTVAIQFESGVTPDPVTGSDVPTYTTEFTTRARVSVGRGLAVRDAEVGGRTAAEVVRELHIPVDSPAVGPRRSALVTAVDPRVDDPTLLGARLILSGSAPGSQTTARRLQVTEVVS